MGTGQGQQDISVLFEEAVLSFVQSAILGSQSKESLRLFLLTETDLLEEMRAGKRSRGPTPDILFVRPITINGRLVKWIDAKLYYASAMFADNSKIPNGKLAGIAKRYNRYYGGEGAFVFGRGFCVDLARHVKGALLLDATPLDMSAVEDFQDASR
jgi:hypothetical protein